MTWNLLKLALYSFSNALVNFTYLFEAIMLYAWLPEEAGPSLASNQVLWQDQNDLPLGSKLFECQLI